MRARLGAARQPAALRVLAAAACAMHAHPWGAAAAREKDKVFFLGPGSTGTRALDAFMSSKQMRGGYRTVHWLCDPLAPGSGWADASRGHDPDLSCLAQHDAFVDHGHSADYRWLDAQFPRARFVLNTRPLRAFLVSRLGHIRTEALLAPRATKRARPAPGLDQCGQPVTPDSWHLDELVSPMPVGSNSTLAQLLLEVAAHQRQVLRYFDASWDRRQRFVALSVSSMHDCEVGELLRWVTRPHYKKFRTTKGIVDAPAKLPHPLPHLNSTERACLTRIAPRAKDRSIHFARMRSSNECVDAVLRKFGCDEPPAAPSAPGDLREFRACAEKAVGAHPDDVRRLLARADGDSSFWREFGRSLCPEQSCSPAAP